LKSKEWLEISVNVDGEAAEAVSALLNQYAYGGAVVEHVVADGVGAHDDTNELRVKAYIQAGQPDLRCKIEEGLWHLSQLYPIPEPTFMTLTEADWANAWKKHYTVLHVGKRTVIVPRWLSYMPQPGEVGILLDPGMAFGTGTHPSTSLCLELLEDYMAPGMAVFDLGTGSGILSIAAAKQGARTVLAVDIDDLAVASARENVAANGVDDIVQVEKGSLERAREPYHLILVNILADVICSLLGAGLADTLRPGGIVIASGIIDFREDEVRAAFVEQGFEVVGRRAERDWVALVARLPEETG